MSKTAEIFLIGAEDLEQNFLKLYLESALENSILRSITKKLQKLVILLSFFCDFPPWDKEIL